MRLLICLAVILWKKDAISRVSYNVKDLYRSVACIQYNLILVSWIFLKILILITRENKLEKLKTYGEMNDISIQTYKWFAFNANICNDTHRNKWLVHIVLIKIVKRHQISGMCLQCFLWNPRGHENLSSGSQEHKQKVTRINTAI